MEVLFAEIGHIGARLQEQFRHDRRHAIEMAGAVGAFQNLGHARDADVGGKAVRVNLVGCGHIQRVDAIGGQFCGVRVFGPRVLVQITGVVELFRVHENRNDNPVGAFPGGFDQRQVARVQRAHGGHDGNAFAFENPAAPQGAQIGLGADQFHVVGTSSAKTCSGAGKLRARTSVA